MRRIKYFIRLTTELVEFAMLKKIYWLLPLMLLLIPAALLIAGGEVVAPLIYTLF